MLLLLLLLLLLLFLPLSLLKLLLRELLLQGVGQIQHPICSGRHSRNRRGKKFGV